MSLHRGTREELYNSLGVGQVLTCASCAMVYDRCDVALEDPEPGSHWACECGCEGFVRSYLGSRRPERRLAERWGDDVVKGGFTALPNLLIRKMAALGITPSHLAILLLHESYRRTGTEAAWPSLKTQAATLGVSVSTVQRRLDELVRAGLIECERPRGPHATFGPNRYTRHGLSRKLAEIAPAVNGQRSASHAAALTAEEETSTEEEPDEVDAVSTAPPHAVGAGW